MRSNSLPSRWSASQNGQVGWIIGDPDVHEFYAKLLDKYERVLKQEDLETLEEMVEAVV